MNEAVKLSISMKQEESRVRYTSEERAQIGKNAAENGPVSALRRSSEFWVGMSNRQNKIRQYVCFVYFLANRRIKFPPIFHLIR